jgi:hypothetical protein
VRIGNVSTGNSQGGMVYGIDGVSQTICSGSHGYGMGNIYDDREAAIIDDIYKSRDERIYTKYSPTLRSSKCGCLKVSEAVKLPVCLKNQRNDYGKQIRKDYEAGKIKERRCNMREYTLRDDGLCNTITTITKDNYIMVGGAMRGRYKDDGFTQQQLEVTDEEVSNCITTVQKDSLVVKKYE